MRMSSFEFWGEMGARDRNVEGNGREMVFGVMQLRDHPGGESEDGGNGQELSYGTVKTGA